MNITFSIFYKHNVLSYFRYNIPWPASMADFVASCRLFLFDVFQITSVDCISPFTFYTPFLIVTVTTTVLIITIFVLHRKLPYVARRLSGVVISSISIFIHVCLGVPHPL